MNFYTNVPIALSETIVDSNNNPISNAAVVVTLYSGRDRLFPENLPGTPVAGFTNVSLGTTNSSGVCTANVAAISSSQMPPTADYIYVLDALVAGIAVSHIERIAVVQVGYQT